MLEASVVRINEPPLLTSASVTIPPTMVVVSIRLAVNMTAVNNINGRDGYNLNRIPGARFFDTTVYPADAVVASPLTFSPTRFGSRGSGVNVKNSARRPVISLLSYR